MFDPYVLAKSSQIKEQKLTACIFVFPSNEFSFKSYDNFPYDLI